VAEDRRPVRIVLDVELDGEAIRGRSLGGDGGAFSGWAQLASVIVDCCASGGATPTNHSEEAGHVEDA
jgi:hypothetical protein